MGKPRTGLNIREERQQGLKTSLLLFSLKLRASQWMLPWQEITNNTQYLLPGWCLGSIGVLRCQPNNFSAQAQEVLRG